VTLSTLTAFSGITNFAPISPDYVNSKLSEVQVAITQLNTDGGSLSSSAKHYIDVHDYGATGDGSTSDRTAFIQAEAARTGSQELRGRSGMTYLLDGTGAGSAWTVWHSGRVDVQGATLLGPASGRTIGTDGGSIGIVNVLANDVTLEANLHGQNAVRFPIALKSQTAGFFFRGSIRSIDTAAGSLWLGIHHAASVDVTGVAIAGRARNVAGLIQRPDCAIVDGNNAISAYTDVTALLLGNSTVQQNTTGMALAMSSGGYSVGVVNPSLLGIPASQSAWTSNVRYGDVNAHDGGFNVLEVYGTGANNSSSFSVPSGRTLGMVLKYGARLGASWGNTGTDDSGYGVVLEGGSAQSTGYLQVAGNAFVSSGTLSLVSAGKLSMTSKSASIDSTNLGVNEIGIFVGGASGVSLAYRSGSTIYYFVSSTSTKA
jgi:hypothetical protein